MARKSKFQKDQSFDYCALHYLNMWIAHDSVYYNGLKRNKIDEKLESLKKAAKYYKVARNLPKKYDKKERYSDVLNIIENVKSTKNSTGTINLIKETEGKISGIYGRKALSFTTKILWLKLQDPIIIYDKKVRTALGTRDGDITQFYEEWQRKYAECEGQIALACARLRKISRYSYNNIPAEEIAKLSSRSWFKKRVFDMYLWHLADDKN